jgi:hypothetical protein
MREYNHAIPEPEVLYYLVYSIGTKYIEARCEIISGPKTFIGEALIDTRKSWVFLPRLIVILLIRRE